MEMKENFIQDFKEALETAFVDNYTECNNSMLFINHMISIMNPRSIGYSYDEYCKVTLSTNLYLIDSITNFDDKITTTMLELIGEDRIEEFIESDNGSEIDKYISDKIMSILTDELQKACMNLLVKNKLNDADYTKYLYCISLSETKTKKYFL